MRRPSRSGVTTSEVLWTSMYDARPATARAPAVPGPGTDPMLIVPPPAPGSRRDPGQLHAGATRVLDRLRVAGVGVTHDAGPRVVRQHALELGVGRRAAVADDDHAGMDRVADPHSA